MKALQDEKNILKRTLIARSAAILTLATMLGCNGAQKRYDDYRYKTDDLVDKAVALVKRRSDSRALFNANPDGHFTAWSSFSVADKSIPMFCPEEYEVTFVASETSDLLDAPRWWVDLSTSTVQRNRNLKNLEAPDYRNWPSDADRIELCMNGKTPVALDPDALPRDSE